MTKPRFYFLFLLIALFSAPSVRAQNSKPVASAHHSLWRVQGTSNVVYLAGSVHLLKPENYPLAMPIQSAYSNSQILVFETDIGKLNDPATQLGLLAKARLPSGETLQSELSPATYRAFTNHLAEAGLPVVMFEMLKPMMGIATLEILELQKLGADPELGLDQYFFKRAKKDDKKIVPLETVDFQIGLIFDFSKPEEELMVKTSLEEIDQTRKYYDDMVSSWQTGNSAKLAKLLNDAMRDSPVIYKRLVTNRNQNWIPKIEKLLRGPKNAMVVVGAGHLVGDEGVVELLKKKGWKITQL
jgi:uncharacterized protein YbaP (TraB family)